MTLHGYLTLPVGVKPLRLPMVVKVHGGPWVRDVWGRDNEAQWLANRGYAVLQVNFRGSTGYGKAYLDAGDREWGGKMETDLFDGKEWAVKEGYADPSKVCIMGSSYGGYATLVALATTREFRCGVDLSGPANLVTFLNNIPAGSSIKAVFTKRVGDVDADQDFLRSRSPLFAAKQITAPLLIAQGANDVRVKQSESDAMVAAIRREGRTVQYIVFPNEGHGLGQPGNRLRFYSAVEAFLATFLGGRIEPPTEDEKIDQLRQ
jgi:dipeptidyl aminopeptidase/acylaminoacyl peptidase